MTRPLLFLLLVLTAACQSAQSAMSLEEAKKVTAQFADSPFVPPPRTIADLKAVLGPSGSGDWNVYRARTQADYPDPEAHWTPSDKARFYLERGRAARRIGRYRQAIDDFTRASGLVTPDMKLQLPGTRPGWGANFGGEILRELGDTQTVVGRYWDARATFEKLFNDSWRLNLEGRRFEARVRLVELYLLTGDLRSADRLTAEQETEYYRSWGYKWPVPEQRTAFESYTFAARAMNLDYRGHHAEAEAHWRAAIAATLRFPHDWWLATLRYSQTGGLAICLLKQRRLLEAEVEARKALRSMVDRDTSGWEIPTLARVLTQVLRAQGRYAEARATAEATTAMFEQGGAPPRSSIAVIAPHLEAAALLAADGQWTAALDQYALARKLLDDEPLFARLTQQDATFAFTLLRAGRSVDAEAVLIKALEQIRRDRGESDPSVAELYALRAAMLAARGDTAGARKHFADATARLIDGGERNDREVVSQGERAQRRAWLLAQYIELLGHGGRPVDLAESFRIAGAVQLGSVQSALDASAARSAARTPELAELVRREQDAGKQIAALQGILAAGGSPGRQSDSELNEQIEKLRKARTALAQQIARGFPAYAELVNPAPVTLEQARAALRPGEALITTLVTEGKTYVWVLPHSGSLAFAAAPLGEKVLAEKVNELRRALDPRVETLGDVPPYDVALGHELYRQLLEPVKTAWSGAERLLVVAHGPLGQLPFHALVTAPVTLETERAPVFSNYRSVPWLARGHAVTTVPSVGALVTLRRQPSGPADRKPFVGFGDPYFSEAQAQEAGREKLLAAARPQVSIAATGETAVRGIRLARREVVVSPGAEVEVSKLAMLPRLPDTAEEIRNIARVMKADVAADVFLGASANEKTVKTLDLTKYRVIAFATHGLVPGDIDGLTQPALALSAPEVAKVEGDGLLTMEEILALRLDADWVVLSACNTANGAGAGAEAISGLGRAFFYAGARALLVTHWPVETTSARALTTGLFMRYAETPGLTRAKALQQAMTALIDEGGRIDPQTGTVVFSYAHPIFWAPFTLVGDGG